MGGVSLLAFLVLCHIVHAEDGKSFSCPKSFHCGKLHNLSFPFSDSRIPHCGFFTVSDCNDTIQTIQLKLGGRFYDVESISQPGTVKINDSRLQENLNGKSCQYFEHFDFLFDNPFKFFHYHRHNLTIFKCSHSSPILPPHHNLLPVMCSSSYNYSLYYTLQDNGSLSLDPPNCSVIQIPVNKTPPMDGDLFDFLSARFSLQVQVDDICVQCFNKGGTCQTANNGSFHCMVKGKSRLKLIFGFLAALIVLSAFFVLRKCAQTNPRLFWKKKTENFKNIEVFLEDIGSLCPKRFSYSDIKKITNSFKDKLGEGGFGGVYRGKLQDGCLVAVKVLKGSKGDGEDFINEISSISRTSHINVVTLLGFCFEGHKRALVYEFMPNGSLEKFIHEKSPLTLDRQLKWETLYKIAVGITRGLEYLHRGCNTRILHFDIKPHNILLDEDFCPKICDFGLAKICPRKESIVSMLGARGTPGYIAPEVFSRNFGGVSHKSDVYSYGMMVLEMVGGRRNIDCEADRTSELYFPQWIYKRLELHQELGLQGITDDEEKEEARKMIIVSMWCIQTNPSSRPPMSRVVEMLEGRIDSLEIPPRPFLSSPSRSPPSDSPVITGSCSSVT